MANVTINEIARQTGVSHQTVSRILGGKANLHKDATVEKVMAAARQLGYRPNASARSMRSGKTRQVAMVHDWRPGRSSLPMPLLDGVQTGLEQQKMHLVLTRHSDEQLTNETFVPSILREVMADGLLINFHTAPPKRMSDLIQQYAIPSVWLNIRRDMDCVYPDDFDGGKRLTQALIERGCKRICYACSGYYSPLFHYSKEDRLEGYRAAMKNAGLATDELLKSEEGNGLRGDLRRRLQADEPMDALISYGHEVHLCLSEVMPAMGLQPGKDVLLATFFNERFELPSTITGIQTPFRQVGLEGVDLLLERISQPNEKSEPKAVPYGKVVG